MKDFGPHGNLWAHPTAMELGATVARVLEGQDPPTHDLPLILCVPLTERLEVVPAHGSSPAALTSLTPTQPAATAARAS